MTGPPNEETEAAGEENAGVGGVGTVIGGRVFELEVRFACLGGGRGFCGRGAASDANVGSLAPDPSAEEERTLALSVDAESRPLRARFLFPFAGPAWSPVGDV